MKVRQALAFALDKQEFLNGAYSGLGTPTNQKLLKGGRWFVSEVLDRKQNLSRAKALLTEAGYPNGVKATIDGFPGAERELQILQAQAKKVGIELTNLIMDFATYSAAHRRGDYQTGIAGGNAGSDPDLAYYAYYHTPPPNQRYSGRAQPCYSNPRVDQLLEDARKVTDFGQRRQMYREVVEILHEEVPDLPIAFIQNGFAFQSYVRDFEPVIISTFSYGNGGVLKTWMDK
jgi:peptide/nickel transport system substrate-binding protein